MRILSLLLLVIFIIVFLFTHSYAQENRYIQIDTVVFQSLILTSPYRVSSNAEYIVQGSPWLRFIDTDTGIVDYQTFHYTGFLPRWQNGTMIYREYLVPQGWGDLPECLETENITFGFYDAFSNINEIYCHIPPLGSNIDLSTLNFDRIDRDPFNDHRFLLNRKFLVDVQTRTWIDLQGTLPTEITPEDTQQWIAHGNIWWDPQTELPIAQIKIVALAESSMNHIEDYQILFCSIEDINCQLIIPSVQSYINGSISDLIISPDGQSILWSVIAFPLGQSVLLGEPIKLIEDVVAFTTDIQTGQTEEIFRLSNYNSGASKGIQAQWAEDGLILVIDIHDDGAQSSSRSLFVRFTTNQCSTTVMDTPTLLAAITTANGTPEADTICLEAGTYTLTTSNNSASDGPNGLPVITSDITLVGLGSGATITRDSAAPAFRILKVDTGARLVLENITVSGGDAGSGSGGGIRNLGTLELRNSVVENNLPDDLSGEGVIIQAER